MKTKLIACFTLALSGIIVLSITCPVNARAVCDAQETQEFVPWGTYNGIVQINFKHIFCGAVEDGQAKGFHSRPNGENPETVSTTSFSETCKLENGDFDDIYKLRGFYITDYDSGRQASKDVSTMFPDKCSVDDVVKAIVHAYDDQIAHDYDGYGMSGNYCTSENGEQFRIKLIINEEDDETYIDSAWPDIE